MTGLTQQLEYVSHLGEGKIDKIQEKIGNSQHISKLLLADVRQVVSDLRALPALDLSSALYQLANVNANANASEKPRLILDLPQQCQFTNHRIAETLFRVVQEILTNCHRHSRAQVLQVRLSQDKDGWHLSAQENCPPPASINFGNGLNGMQERIEQLGGVLEITRTNVLQHYVMIPNHNLYAKG